MQAISVLQVANFYVDEEGFQMVVRAQIVDIQHHNTQPTTMMKCQTFHVKCRLPLPAPTDYKFP